VEIGRGSRVAASAMVSKDVPPFVVVMGNPATVAKQLPAES
jgi:acetyltransferase-like isoleucine patch superfamily enzyme